MLLNCNLSYKGYLIYTSTHKSDFFRQRQVLVRQTESLMTDESQLKWVMKLKEDRQQIVIAWNL